MFKSGCGINIKYTNDLDEFKASGLPKLNYSANKIEGCISVEPHSILFDYGIKDYSIEVSNHPDFLKVFFKTKNGSIGFDFLGAAFWLLSRYEEYLPHKTDKFNRFHYKSSLAYQYDFLDVPLVNLWMHQVKKIFVAMYPQLKFNDRGYNFISTIDIDNAFKYRFKGFVRTVAGYVSDLFRKNFEGIKKRTSIILNKEKDPFDCYEFLIKQHSDLNIRAIYFLLLGDYGINDKNHSASDLRFQALIKHLSDYSDAGIHPSYGSNNNLQQLKIEISRLSNITHRQITKSRQHFSMLKFPSTYLALQQAGITEDYSMGYTNMNGFRASYCYPYNWYSLEDEQKANFLIHPFCITENTLNFFAREDSQKFIDLADPLINQVKNYGGELISIFHNDSFTEKMKTNYLNFLKTAISHAH